MLKKIGKLSLIIIVFVALTACNSNSNGGSGNTDSDKYKFAFLPNTQNNSFQTAMTQRFEELSKEEDFDFTMLDPDYDLNEQLSQMSDAANQKLDAVFIIPVDSSGIRQGLEQLNDMNIPVFNVDTAVTEEDRDLVESVIATDAFMAGQLMGEQMVQNYPDGAKIAILDFPSNESTVERVKGFMDGLGDDESKFEIVAQQDGKATTDDSLPIAEDIIQANPDLDAFFAINDPSALGVVSAIEHSGQEDIDVYSIDASPDGKDALINGKFTAVSAQVPIGIAESAVESALDKLEGKDVDKEIYLPSHVVDKEEAEETKDEWQ